MSFLPRLVVGCLLLSSASLAEEASAAAPASEQRLVSLGVKRDAAVPDDIHRTLEDTFRAQLSQAASDRGFAEVPLSRVAGLEETAAACRSAACRLGVTGRLRATHSVRGHLERGASGYRLTLFLEDGTSGAFLAGKRMTGDVPKIVGALHEKVDELLEEASPKRAVAMGRLAKTARAYLEKGRDDDALKTLERAIDISPFHPDGAALQRERVMLIEKRGDEEATFKALLDVVEMYGPRSLWTLAGIGEGAAQSHMHLWLRQKLAAIGTHNQREARLLEDRAKRDEKAEVERVRRLERAERAYARYLDEFPDAPDAAELELYLAELEFARGAYVDAAAHYAGVLQEETATDELKRQAASSAVYAYEKELEAAVTRGDLEKLDLTAPLSPLPNATGLAPEERAFVAAVDQLTERFPDVEDADAFAYRAAQLCVFRGELDEGKRRLADVARQWPKTKAGKLSAAALQGL